MEFEIGVLRVITRPEIDPTRTKEGKLPDPNPTRNFEGLFDPARPEPEFFKPDPKEKQNQVKWFQNLLNIHLQKLYLSSELLHLALKRSLLAFLASKYEKF